MSCQNIITFFHLNLGEVIISWIFEKKSMSMEEISEPVLKLWNNWELRVLVLLSLTLQLSLFHFGRRRRYSVKAGTHIFLWCCYLVADSVATVALGVISSKQRYSCGYNHNNSQLQYEFTAFWAPFMLLHLGGQDTITAYAVQDNELWLRHFLGLVVQSGVALYIFFTSWKGNWLSFISIPMIVAGFIKYAERIWVMRSANRNPNVILIDSNRGLPFEAHANFQRFRPLFLNQNIHYILKRETSKKFREYDYETAFKMIEIELGHAYDDFYTKTPLFFTRLGCFSRCITFSSVVFVFIIFLVSERHKHLRLDLIITYILLGGAVVIEIYALILLITSDTGRLWLETYIPFSEPIVNIDQLPEKQRWSNSMGQFNMVIFFSKNKPGIAEGKPKFFAELKVWFYHHILPELNLRLEKNFYMTNKQISNDLKRLVWEIFLEKLNPQTQGFFKDYNLYISEDKTLHLEIHESIIIWHVATDLCFYNNDINDGIPANETNEETKKDIDTKKKVIKEISDYMMYILAFCPFLLSAGRAKITFEESCEWLRRVHKEEKFTGSAMSDVFDKLIVHLSKFRDTYVSKDYRRLHYALQVAKNLERNEQKWLILTRFWIENLAHVATICQGNNHAQLLRKGGECLTQVRFLIEHLDLHERFRMPLKVPEDEE